MDDLWEKVIKGLGCCSVGADREPTWNNLTARNCGKCPYNKTGLVCTRVLSYDALSLLKAQELPDVKPEKLEERTTKWLDQMTAEERLEEIAAILDDWDGYRTAKGLAGLINEVWAYALYPVKEQEPRVMTLEEVVSAECVWIEYAVSGNVVIALPWDIEITDDTYHFICNPNCIVEFRSLYGEEWRCWTSRPTDEQREKVKWE